MILKKNLTEVLYRIQKDQTLDKFPKERYYSCVGINRQAYYQLLQQKDSYDIICNELRNNVL